MKNLIYKKFKFHTKINIHCDDIAVKSPLISQIFN